MKQLFSLIILLTYSFAGYNQQLDIITTLNDSVKETSGLIYLNQQIITHNDSGGEAALYELDSLTGNVTRKVVIDNASNIDWEDICTDSLYIYIGDFGNNNGSRTNLKIYRLLISDYLTTTNDTVSVDTISFSYADQIDFTPTSLSTNFDAEALIAIGDSLYIFTKNWSNGWTNIYPLSKIPGTYQALKVDSLNTLGLVTGASYNPQSNTIALTGYTFLDAFFIKISQFNNNLFSTGTIDRFVLQTQASFQIEGITSINQNEYYLSSEQHSSGTPTLYRFNDIEIVGIENPSQTSDLIYPNPTSDFVIINSTSFKYATIYDVNGVVIKNSTSKKIDISNFKKGVYFMVIKNTSSNGIEKHKFIVN
ncbi:MAG: T9SS type A sorting domain-containing protein [Flavobacteriales bacterium]|nr:T9SS type A sorting domain-containing protein [Flavobacteriales bacterium]